MFNCSCGTFCSEWRSVNCKRTYNHKHAQSNTCFHYVLDGQITNSACYSFDCTCCRADDTFVITFVSGLAKVGITGTAQPVRRRSPFRKGRPTPLMSVTSIGFPRPVARDCMVPMFPNCKRSTGAGRTTSSLSGITPANHPREGFVGLPFMTYTSIVSFRTPY